MVCTRFYQFYRLPSHKFYSTLFLAFYRSTRALWKFVENFGERKSVSADGGKLISRDVALPVAVALIEL